MKLRAPFSELSNAIKGDSNAGNVKRATRANKLSIVGDYDQEAVHASRNHNTRRLGKPEGKSGKRGCSFPNSLSAESPFKQPPLKQSNASVKNGESLEQDKHTDLSFGITNLTLHRISNENKATEEKAADYQANSISNDRVVATTSRPATSTPIILSSVETSPHPTVDDDDDDTVDFSKLSLPDELEKQESPTSAPPEALRCVSYDEDEVAFVPAQERVVVLDSEGRPHFFCNVLKKPDWLFDYWQSSGARKLFAVNEGETAKAAIARHIDALDGLNEATWQSYCEPNIHYIKDEINKENVTTKATYLLAVLHIAHEGLSNCASFIECCHQAVLFLSTDVPDLYKVDDPSLLYSWFVDFRANHKFKLNMLPGQEVQVPYWESREARTFFGVTDDISAKDAILGYIEHIEKFETNYNELIVDGLFDSLDEIPDQKRKALVTKTACVVRALSNAVEYMPGISWTACCGMACQELTEHKATAKGVRRFFREYINNGRKFQLTVKKDPAPVPEVSSSLNVRHYM